MAIKFIKERKKQKYLIIGFGAILLVTAVVLWFGYFKKEKPDEFLPIGVVPVREIEINFGVLENPLLIEFQPFVKISTLLIGAKDISLTPTLSWESVPGAEIYFWEIIGVASDKTTETSVTVSEKLKPSTTYVWRVMSCKEGGAECSAWSNRTFTTVIFLFPPGLVSPQAEEIFVGRENPFLPY